MKFLQKTIGKVSVLLITLIISVSSLRALWMPLSYPGQFYTIWTCFWISSLCAVLNSELSVSTSTTSLDIEIPPFTNAALPNFNVPRSFVNVQSLMRRSGVGFESDLLTSPWRRLECWSWDCPWSHKAWMHSGVAFLFDSHCTVLSQAGTSPNFWYLGPKLSYHLPDYFLCQTSPWSNVRALFKHKNTERIAF